MGYTIYDIAKHANVSKSTVSRVINNSPNISEKTRKQVLESMKKLNFTPNKMAQGLSSASFDAISIMYTRPLKTTKENPYFSNVIAAIGAVAELAHFDLILQVSQNEDIEKLLHKIKTNMVKGIILLSSPNNESLLQQLDALQIPIIIIGHVDPGLHNVYSVDTDNYHDSYNLTKYLIDNGHTQIGCLHPPLDFHVSIDRVRGFRDCLKHHDLPINESWILEAGYGIDDAYTASYALLTNQDRPTAIFATDDLKIFSLYKVAQEYGIHIPDELSITGYMNYEFSLLLQPALTSIEIPTEQLGMISAQLLLDKVIHNTDIPKQTMLETHFHIQDSVKSK